MAKVKGPLFSVAASGKFNGVMEFRAGATQTTVHGPRAKGGPRSAAQLAQSLRFGNAVAAWKALDEAGKAAWKTAGAAAGMTGYQLFISEYQTQNISPPGLPTVP